MNIYIIIKRLFDILFSLIGIILMIPISVIIKVSYIINKDYNTIFYSQDRVGKNGKVFKLYKFRTMIVNADEELNNLLNIKEYKDEWDKNQKIKNDPRITKVGKVLRKYSLDEIPQFINVFLGSMSLIGPRPLIEGEIEKHGGNKKLYESVKPGITTWWGVNSDKAKTYEERLNCEYYYINNMSFILDLKCFFKTIKVIIKGK